MSDFAEKVIAVVERHRAVSAVRLAGSRSGDTAVELSDWDFAVEVTDFGAAREALPALVSPLRPLARQWDRLAEHPAYMLMLRGPVKVDFLFLGQAHEGAPPPWTVARESLGAIDDHFWDWILWIASKHQAGRSVLVGEELAKLHAHLLRPIGVQTEPSNVEGAISAYEAARGRQEETFQTAVPRKVEREVRPALRRAGHRV